MTTHERDPRTDPRRDDIVRFEPMRLDYMVTHRGDGRVHVRASSHLRQSKVEPFSMSVSEWCERMQDTTVISRGDAS